jgi:hypothetical protein
VRRDISDVRLCRRNVATSDSADDARRKDQRERVCEGKCRVGDRRGKESGQDNRAPTDLVRPPTAHRRHQELHEREDGTQQADGERARAKRLGVERQQRDDDPEPQKVDEDRDEDDDER